MSRLIKTSLLLFFFAVCAVAAIATHRAQERTPRPAAHDLYSLVTRQLSDFRTADFDSAYRQAATGVQQKFSRPQFEMMVRQNFPSITRARRIEFGSLQIDGAAAVAHVFVTTPDGAIRSFLYSFIAERDGWKISGLQAEPEHSARHFPGLQI